MKATFPIITCDYEDGCDQWTLDWYEALVTNWRECMVPGWQYDPHTAAMHLCPEHTKARIAPAQGGDVLDDLWWEASK